MRFAVAASRANAASSGTRNVSRTIRLLGATSLTSRVVASGSLAPSNTSARATAEWSAWEECTNV